MITTQILLWKTTKTVKKVPGNIKYHYLFCSEVIPLTRDVTCFKLYWDRKNMRRECQMSNLLCCTYLSKLQMSKKYLIIFCWLFCCDVFWVGSKNKKSNAYIKSLFFNLSYWLAINLYIDIRVYLPLLVLDDS